MIVIHLTMFSYHIMLEYFYPPLLFRAIPQSPTQLVKQYKEYKDEYLHFIYHKEITDPRRLLMDSHSRAGGSTYSRAKMTCKGYSDVYFLATPNLIDMCEGQSNASSRFQKGDYWMLVYLMSRTPPTPLEPLQVLGYHYNKIDGSKLSSCCGYWCRRTTREFDPKIMVMLKTLAKGGNGTEDILLPKHKLQLMCFEHGLRQIGTRVTLARRLLLGVSGQ